MMSRFVVYGALYALLAVALGAFGAHGLEGKLSERMLENYETAVRYQMYHALGLLLVGVLSDKLGGGRLLVWSGRLLQLGILLFSGSLYVLSLTGYTKLGIVAPFGGLSFIVGWVLLMLAAWKHGQRN